MKKNHRDQYLKSWLTYLKGKNQIDPKALADYLRKNLKGALAPITLKRYTATVIINLYENGFLAGKKGKTFSGEPLEIIQEITFPILDKALTSNYKKIKFTDLEKAAEIVETFSVAPKAKKPKRGDGKKEAEEPEVVSGTAPKKPARKAAKSKAKKVAEPRPKKMAAAKAEKPARRKPVPKKKVMETPRKAAAAKARKAPGRKPGGKAAATVPGARGRTMTGQQADVIQKGQAALEFFLDQQRQIDEMAQVIVNYERVFAAVRGLFSREMDEIEELVGGLLD